MKDSIHIIQTEFSRRLNKPLEWWQHRLKIFEHYTVNSLKCQTNKDFYITMALRNQFPEELKNELWAILNRADIPYLTIYPDEPKDIEEKFEKYIPPSKYIHATRIDSDDLFHQDVVEEIQQHEFAHRRALIFQKGYCFDAVNNQLQHYKAMSPPNFTIIYPREIFYNQEKLRAYLSVEGHDQIYSNMNSVLLSKNKYLILIHGIKNRSVYAKDAYQLERYSIPVDQHESILNNFNITLNTFKEKICKE